MPDIRRVADRLVREGRLRCSQKGDDVSVLVARGPVRFRAVRIRRTPPLRSSCMPAKSKKQQMAAGAALAAKRGEKSKGSLRGASKSMASSMSEKELEEIAHTKRKALPKRAGGAKSKR